MADKEDLKTQESVTPTDSSAEDFKEANSEEHNDERTFSQDKVNEIVADRVSREREKLLKEFEQEKEQIREEVERLAKLSAEEREQEHQKQTRKKLERKEREINLKSSKLIAVQELANASLPTEFSDFLLTESEEETKSRVESFVETFRKAVANEVEKRISDTPPKDPANNQSINPASQIVRSF